MVNKLKRNFVWATHFKTLTSPRQNVATPDAATATTHISVVRRLEANLSGLPQVSERTTLPVTVYSPSVVQHGDMTA